LDERPQCFDYKESRIEGIRMNTLKTIFFFIISKELNEEPRVRVTLYTKNILNKDEKK
jgi:hypothetical protein